MTSHCDFCSIAGGQDETAEVVAEGKAWVAFFPLEPATPGHTLVIPRRHVRDLWDLDEQTAGIMINAAVSVGNAIQKALAPDGMNLITSSGRAAEQTVFHLHFHIVPRWTDDGFGRIWPPDSTSLTSRTKEGLADQIRDAILPYPA